MGRSNVIVDLSWFQCSGGGTSKKRALEIVEKFGTGLSSA